MGKVKNFHADFKSSSDTLEMLMENVPDIIYSLDPEGKFLSLNQATELVLGYKPEELIGQSVFKVIHPDDIELVKKGFEQSVKTGEHTSKILEFRMITKSGEVKYFEIRRRIYFEEKKMVRNVGIAFDITERKKNEDQLKEHSEKLEKRVEERTEKLEYANRQLAALNGVANRFSLIYDEKTLLDEVPTLLTHSLDFDRTALILFENDQIKLRSCDFGEESAEKFECYLQLLNEKKVPPPYYLDDIIKKNKTVFIQNCQKDPDWPEDSALNIPIKSLIAAPIRVQSKTIGVIEGDMQFHEREMDSQDVARFEMFVNMVGLALDNIRAYSNMESKVAERTNSLNKTNKSLKEKAAELQKTSYKMATANVELLAVKEQLENKNSQTEILLEQFSQSRDELQSILDIGMKVIVMVNTDGIITATNQEIKNYFDIEYKDLLNQPFSSFLNQITDLFEDKKKAVSLFADLEKRPDSSDSELMEIDKIYQRVLTLNHPKKRYISIFSFLVTSKTDKKILGRVWAFSDVSKLKEADEQIHAIVEVSPIPFVISRMTDGEVLYVNKPMANLIGAPVEKLKGQKTPDFYADPDERALVLGKLKKDGQLFNHEIQLRKADGNIIWMVMSIVSTELSGDPVFVVSLYDITERKQGEEALKQAHKIYQDAIENVDGVPYVKKYDQSKYEYVGDGVLNLLGISDKEITGTKMKELTKDIVVVDPEAPIDPYEYSKAFLRGEVERYRVDLKILTEDGEEKWVSDCSVPVKDDQTGKVVGSLGILQDITERKHAEEKLQLYREVFHNSNDGIMIFDPETYFLERNDASRRMFPMPDEELQGQTADLIFGKERTEKMRQTIMETGSYREIVANQLNEKSTVYVDLAVFPILNSKGELTCIAGMGRDITESKQAAEALRVSEERFRSLVENAHDIIFSLNPDGTFSYISPQFTVYTGFETKQFIGKSLEPLFHPNDTIRSKEIWQDVNLAEESKADYEYRIKQKNGTWRWFVVHSTIIKNEDGKIIEIVGIAHDVTETKNMLENLENSNQELRETQFQLVQSEKMASLGMLVAGIAHEINTPVGAINSMHNTLMRAIEKLKSELATNCSEFYQENKPLNRTLQVIEDANKVIQSGTERVTNIVRRLRSFARLDEAELKKIDIHEGIEDTLTIIHHQIKHKIKLVKKYGKIPQVSCFPGRLNQVFLNLLNNANQAIKDKGKMTITTGIKENNVFISIQDNGKGISKENQKKIFDPGFTTKGVGVGTGLGLSICYKIMQEHHGEILVDSALGKGSTFTVVFPMDLDKKIDEMVIKTGF